MHPQLKHGIELFNAADFHQAHEILEAYWNESDGYRKTQIQTLIQFTVALYLWQQAREEGARKVLNRAQENLKLIQNYSFELDLPDLESQILRIFLESGAGRDINVKIAFQNNSNHASNNDQRSE